LTVNLFELQASTLPTNSHLLRLMALFTLDLLKDMPTPRQFVAPSRLKDITFQPTSHDKVKLNCDIATSPVDHQPQTNLDGGFYSSLDDFLIDNLQAPLCLPETSKDVPFDLYPLPTNMPSRGSDPLSFEAQRPTTQSILQLSSTVDTINTLPSISVEDLAAFDEVAVNMNIHTSDSSWSTCIDGGNSTGTDTDTSCDELVSISSCEIPYVPTTSHDTGVHSRKSTPTPPPTEVAASSSMQHNHPVPANRVESKYKWDDSLLTMSRRDFSQYTRTNKDRLSKDALDDLRKTRRRMKNRLYQKDARDRQCMKTFKQRQQTQLQLKATVKRLASRCDRLMEIIQRCCPEELTALH
jgi:hypothetical protein